jgi:hypothetical protein
MDEWEEKVRLRAYHIWERQGRTGNPYDHWHAAERELRAEEAATNAEDRSQATTQEATPVEAVEAAQATKVSPKDKDSSGS